MEIAQQEYIPLHHYYDPQLQPPTSSKQYVESLEEHLLKHTQDYLDKIELGRQITTIIGITVIKEERVCYIYTGNKNHEVTVTHIELRPCQ